jgi:hypothetical protein
MDMERAWFAARRPVAGRRRHSRAAMAVNNAAVPLEGFCAAGFAVELTIARSGSCSGWRR